MSEVQRWTYQTGSSREGCARSNQRFTSPSWNICSSSMKYEKECAYTVDVSYKKLLYKWR